MRKQRTGPSKKEYTRDPNTNSLTVKKGLVKKQKRAIASRKINTIKIDNNS
jgi:uncharacterized membrane protein YdbT with pleckstrin-like domain